MVPLTDSKRYPKYDRVLVQRMGDFGAVLVFNPSKSYNIYPSIKEASKKLV